MAGDWAIVAAAVGTGGLTGGIPAYLQYRLEKLRQKDAKASKDAEMQAAAKAADAAEFEAFRAVHTEVVRCGAMFGSYATGEYRVALGEALGRAIAVGQANVRHEAKQWLNSLATEGGEAGANVDIYMDLFIEAMKKDGVDKVWGFGEAAREAGAHVVGRTMHVHGDSG